MQAQVKQEGDVFYIHLSGKVDFDSSEPFRNTILRHVKGSRVIFNLQGLNFVGSNGITPFVETMKTLCAESGSLVRFCNVSSEFQRIFEANEIFIGANFEDEKMAYESLQFSSAASMPSFQENVPQEAMEPIRVSQSQQPVIRPVSIETREAVAAEIVNIKGDTESQ